MRKFRFIGDPEEWNGGLKKNVIYNEDKIVINGYDDEFGYDWNVLRIAEAYPEDWQEVFEGKKLHKDTDLGYFAGVALHGLLANSKNYDSTVNFSIAAIETAKELIQQLDQEQ